jgi:hypothetical protein
MLDMDFDVWFTAFEPKNVVEKETDDDDDIKKNTTIFKGKCCITLE